MSFFSCIKWEKERGERVVHNRARATGVPKYNQGVSGAGMNTRRVSRHLPCSFGYSLEKWWWFNERSFNSFALWNVQEKFSSDDVDFPPDQERTISKTRFSRAVSTQIIPLCWVYRASSSSRLLLQCLPFQRHTQPMWLAPLVAQPRYVLHFALIEETAAHCRANHPLPSISPKNLLFFFNQPTQTSSWLSSSFPPPTLSSFRVLHTDSTFTESTTITQTSVSGKTFFKKVCVKKITPFFFSFLPLYYRQHLWEKQKRTNMPVLGDTYSLYLMIRWCQHHIIAESTVLFSSIYIYMNTYIYR